MNNHTSIGAKAWFLASAWIRCLCHPTLFPANNCTLCAQAGVQTEESHGPVTALLALNEMHHSVEKDQLGTQIIYIHLHIQPQNSCRQRSYSALCLNYWSC